MGILLPEFLHGALEGTSRLTSSNEFTIEMLHQLRGALIVHVPQGQEQGGSACTEKATLKPE